MEADQGVGRDRCCTRHDTGGKQGWFPGVGRERVCERRKAILYVPAVVMWECALLARAGRVNLRRSVRGFFDDLFSNPAFQPHDLTAGQVLLGEELRINRDRFDALICAVAADLQLPLITRDTEIRGSGRVRAIW